MLICRFQSLDKEMKHLSRSKRRVVSPGIVHFVENVWPCLARRLAGEETWWGVSCWLSTVVQERGAEKNSSLGFRQRCRRFLEEQLICTPSLLVTILKPSVVPRHFSAHLQPPQQSLREAVEEL